ncbi:MAG: ArsR/SmtB family transcription factor [Candidatus Helarchaeota archaeon]
MNEISKQNNELENKSMYWWLFGRSGGKTRIRIIKLLLERPYNANQLSNILNMSYRNIKHHLILLENAKIVYVNSAGYGKLFILSPNFNINLFNEIVNMCQKNVEELTLNY